MLAPAVVVGDRYRLVSRIAVGGMGDVWRAEDLMLHRQVAIKVLKPELSADATFLDRFRNEARSAAAFHHQGIANVYDYGEAPPEAGTLTPIAYLVMELVEGEPLSAILAREGRLRPEVTLDYVAQAAAALQVAHHAGVVHRDIKPGNLLVTADGQVKITDFGIARAASTVPLTRAGMVMGTAQYFSPEQAEGLNVDARSDVYSLGVLAYECLAGRLPFTADNPVTVAMMQIRNAPPPLPADVPPAIRAVVQRAMAKDPGMRYVDGGDLHAALRAAAAGRFDPPPPGPSMMLPPASAPHPVGPPPLAAPMRAPGSSPVLLASSAIAVVVVLAALITWLVLRSSANGAQHNTDPGNPQGSVRPSAAQPRAPQGSVQRTSSPSRTPSTGTSAPSTPSTASTSAPRSSGSAASLVRINPADYRGLPATQVAQALQRRGLRTQILPGAPGGRLPGTVTVSDLVLPPDDVISVPVRVPRGTTILLEIGRRHPPSVLVPPGVSSPPGTRPPGSGAIRSTGTGLGH